MRVSDFTACVAPRAVVRERVLALIAAEDYAEAARLLKCRQDFSARDKAEVLMTAIDRQLAETSDVVRALLKAYELVLDFKGAAVKWTKNFWLPLAKSVWKNREEIAEYLQITEDAVDRGPGGFRWHRLRWVPVLDRLDLSPSEQAEILAEMERLWHQRRLDSAEPHARIEAGIAEYDRPLVAMDGNRLQTYFAHPDGVDLTTLSRTLVYQNWRSGDHRPATLRGAYYDLMKPLVARVLRAYSPGAAVAGGAPAGYGGAAGPARVDSHDLRHRRLFQSRADDAFYHALAYFTTRTRLFRYADLGLVSSPQEYAAHHFGPRPVVLVLEKAAHWVTLAPILSRYQVAGLALGGFPSLIVMEAFAADLQRHARGWAEGLDLYLLTDFDPWGANIAARVEQLLRSHGLPLRRTVQLFQPRALVAAGLLDEDEAAEHAFPLELQGRAASYRSLVQRWLRRSGGGVAGQFPGLHLPLDPPLSLGYDVLGTQRLAQLVEDHLRRV